MSAPVDVLSVLDSLIEYHDTSDSLKGRNCIAARAAVAELIEAVTDAAMRRTYFVGNDYRRRMDRLYAAVYAANGDKPLTGDLASRVPANLADALARVGGAS